jgi:hypothetical protein
MVSRSALEATAYHEAGHLVVAWTEGAAISRVSIVPERERAGFVHHSPIMGRFNPEWDNSPQVRIRGERLIRVCLAGPIAQRRFNPRSWRHYHGESDHEKATDVILRLAAPGEHANTYMRLLRIEAKMAVNQHWAMIGALAAELIERRKMTGAEATAFIRSWQRDASYRPHPHEVREAQSSSSGY